MQGIAICDLSGRRLLTTHFPSPLILSLAIDAVTSISNPASVTWVPNLEAVVDDDEDAEEDGDGWKEKEKAGGGFAVCMIERRGLRYIVPVLGDIDPVVPLTYLTQLHAILESYLSGPATESSLKDNFDIVLALFHESLSSSPGACWPTLTSESQLKELVVPPSQLLQKVASVAGLAIPSSTGANMLLQSPLPWRRQGLKYSSNEIYFDLLETLSILLTPTNQPGKSKILSGSLTGKINCRTRLSGMPDLNLEFGDPSLLEDASFHECVRYNRWSKEKLVSFVPPDGSFPLLSYSIPISTSPLTSLTLLPLTLIPTITSGISGGTFHFTLTSVSPPSRPLTNLRITMRLPKGAVGVSGTLSGGAWPKEGSNKGGGAGRWEVKDAPGAGEGVELNWTLERLVSTDRPAIWSGGWNSSNQIPLPTSIAVTFSSPDSNFSGVRIKGCKLSNNIGGGGEQYNVFKGVRLQGVGEVEVRI